MPDRLALPNDRHEACRTCGSMKREYLTECTVCQKQICSECRIEERDDAWSTFTVDLCSGCALKELDAQLVPITPAWRCTCEYPAWSRYGQQLPLEAA